MQTIAHSLNENDTGIHALQARIAHGDEYAFAKVFSLYNKRLTVFATSILHAKELAEEAVQDVFIKLWVKRSEILAIQNLSVYLYVAVKNQSLNKLSDKAKKLITEPFDGINPKIQSLSDDPHSIFITTEMLARVNVAVEALPPRCKMIFKLIREDGLRYKEVAEILNISVNTIDVQMAIAVKRICEAMGVSKQRMKAPNLPIKSGG